MRGKAVTLLIQLTFLPLVYRNFLKRRERVPVLLTVAASGTNA
jgi:hypothetical protein